MSEAIDLTATGDDSSSGSGSGIASDDGTTSPRAWPSTVYLVIHDGEPQDSGSDYRSMSPARQDTEIVGIFYGIGRAVRAAEVYVQDELGGRLDHSEVGVGSCGGIREEGEPIDWEGDGWFHSGGEFVADRVYIQGYRVH